jgi:hypothetical protein
MAQDDRYEDDWKDEAPTLASLDKHVDFEVPEGYFEELPSAVMARIQAMSQAEVAPPSPQVAAMPAPTHRRFGIRRTLLWSAAAGIALFMAVGAYYVTRPTAPETGTFASLDEEVRAQLAALEPAELMEDLGTSTVNDEELFAMLGKDAGSAFEAHGLEVQRDEAYEYLQDVDLDAIDLEGLDIDLKDLD